MDLFLTEDIMDLILKMTNLQGRRANKEWMDLDLVDLRGYIGLLLLAGVYRSKNESLTSLWEEETGRIIFRATMSLKKFRLISDNVRFDDKRTRRACFRNDKLAAFRTLWEKWTSILPVNFNPGRDICVDEQLVPFRGRCAFRQYIPSKPAKYGLKIYLIYGEAGWTSRRGGTGEAGPPRDDRGAPGLCCHLRNFFTSYGAAEEHLKSKIALVGTIRKNKPKLPPQLLQVRGRATHSSIHAFTRTATAVSYIPKRGRNVLLLSAKHHRPEIRLGKQKPAIILAYNRCKGGVDNLDKVVSCRRKTNRWPVTLFHNLLDVSAYNAFVVWTTVDLHWNARKTPPPPPSQSQTHTHTHTLPAPIHTF
ncbi:piggyBac transposable element-derived protein 4-like [Micropterus salmoides]|uniref:piggyBac transposable element-derived protein 4-like n=1 Tax=Micropterus salmoides TaxID=27706 RepID=UPI0018EAB056|nr:piggyBac transposable element-derived protein 4-like [Micropterus salmoides]